jgi:AraC-like DNA-binding protein
LIKSGSLLPDILQVAAKLHVPEHILRRRLSNESTNFRTICDEVKNVLACQYLLQTEFTAAEIANLLDYSETVSFRRALMHWNGLPPGQFRQRQSLPSIS